MNLGSGDAVETIPFDSQTLETERVGKWDSAQWYWLIDLSILGSLVDNLDQIMAIVVGKSSSYSILAYDIRTIQGRLRLISKEIAY